MWLLYKEKDQWYCKRISENTSDINQVYEIVNSGCFVVMVDDLETICVPLQIDTTDIKIIE